MTLPAKILLTNDDGHSARGIEILFEVLSEHFDVIMVAPERERSTCGHSMTLHKPLRLKSVGQNRFFVSGTPVDCVILGLREIFKDQSPTYVVSGINHGANLGQDVFYSGTVAGAREGALSGIPAFALSLNLPGIDHTAPQINTYFNDACVFFSEYLRQYHSEWKAGQLWNFNFPPVERAHYQGLRRCALGRKHYSPDILAHQDLRGRQYYWIGGKYLRPDKIENTDCLLIEDNFVTLTPLNLNQTNYELLKH